MALNKVLVSIPINDEYKERFLKSLPGREIQFARFENLSQEELSSFDAVVGNPDADTLNKLSRMKFLQLMSSGVAGHYLKLKDRGSDFVLCSATGAYGQAISEHLVATLMMLLKRLHVYRDDMKTAQWEPRGKVLSPRDLTVLVVGAGNIGTEFAKLMKLLGSKVLGLRRSQGGALEGFDEMHTMDALDSLLPKVDVVALSLPESPQTINLFDEKRFSLMKQGSYLLNVGRGSAVNQEALLKALREEKLAGAAIDVTTPEPLPKDHPLWQEKNLLLTPHISGYFWLKATHDTLVDIACDNLAAWPQGPYQSWVNYETGYRER